MKMVDAWCIICSVFYASNLSWIFAAVSFLMVLLVVRVEQRPTLSKALAFPHRLERIPLIRHLSIHFSFMRTMKATGVDYSVLFMNFILGELERFRKTGVFVFYLGTQPNFILFRADHIEKTLNNSINIAKGHVYDLLLPWLWHKEGFRILTKLMRFRSTCSPKALSQNRRFCALLRF